MQLMLFFLFGSAVLAGMWWWLVVTRYRDSYTSAQIQQVGSTAVVLSVISLLWVCSLIRTLLNP
jgi:hypothetical protein